MEEKEIMEQEEQESEEVFNKLKKLFDDNNIKYNLLIHGGNAKTSEEVAKLRGTPLETGAKAMIIKIDDGFIEVVIPADKKFASRPAKKFLKTDCLRFGTKEELKNITNCIQGSVPPFGSLFGLKTVSIYSGDRTTPRLDIIGVRKGVELQTFIRERVEFNKQNRLIYEITNR